MTKIFPACAGAALAVIVPAWLFTAPLSAQGQGRPQEGQAQERGETRGSGGGGGGAATPHAGQAPSGGSGGGATGSSGGQSSGGGGGYTGGGRSEGGSRREGATGGGGNYAVPRDRGERTSARPADGGASAPSGGARNGGEGRYRGAPREGGVRSADAPNNGGEAVPEYARPREGRTPVGTAVPRGSVPSNPPTRGGIYVPGGGYYGGYGYYDPWGYGGYSGYGGYPGYGGYGGAGYYGGYYDPWYGGYPVSPQSSYTSSDEGSLKLKLKPRDAEVYVDGYFVGIVDDFDGIFQKMHVESGAHRIEVRAPGYEPLAFDVRITVEHTTTYQGELKRIP
jgi:hypothetical protein